MPSPQGVATSPGAFFCAKGPKTCANGTCIRGRGWYNGSIKNTQEKGGYDHETKKFLALALAGVMTAVTLTACAPLDALYDWFFGGGGSASRGNEKSLVTESEELEKQLEKYFGLSETTASARAKETLEEVAKGFDAGWLDNNNMLNETSITALDSITKAKLQAKQALWVDVMELTSPGGTADITLDNRPIYSDRYVDPGPDSGDPYHWVYLVDPSNLRRELDYYKKNDAELYAGTFQKDGKNYAAMVTIMNGWW